MIVLFVLLDGCSFFPGFFQSQANVIAGVNTGWNVVKDYNVGFPVNLNINGDIFNTWDMSVNSYNNILLAEVSSNDNNPYVFEYKNNSWNLLANSYIYNTIGYSYFNISVAYSYDGSDFIPYCGFGYFNSGNTVEIFAYNVSSGPWPSALKTIAGNNYVDIIQKESIAPNGPTFFTYDNASMLCYGDMVVANTSIGSAGNIQFLECDYEPHSDSYGISKSDSFNINNFRFDSSYNGYQMANGIISSSALDHAAFAISDAFGPIHGLTTLISNNDTIVIYHTVDTNNRILHVFSDGNYTDIATTYNHDEKVLYIATVKPIMIGTMPKGHVQVYRYNEMTDEFRLMGTMINDINASSVKIRHLPGATDKIYVGITDIDQGNRIKIFSN